MMHKPFIVSVEKEESHRCMSDCSVNFPEVETLRGVRVVQPDSIRRSCMGGSESSLLSGKLVKCCYKGEQIIIKHLQENCIDGRL